MSVIAITQARTGSTRFPNKVLKEIEGKSLLQIHLERLKRAELLDDIYIATTTRENDQAIVDLASKLNVKCYRGSEDDVLDRFYQAVRKAAPKFVVRVTSDCPLIDPQLIDELINQAIKKDLDYYSNILQEKFPDGQDIEVFKFSALENAWANAALKSEREHVTPYIRNNSSYLGGNLFTSENHDVNENYNAVRMTVDEPKDYEVIKLLIRDLGLNQDWKSYALHYLKNPAIRDLNQIIKRNEGYFKSLDVDQSHKPD